MTTAMVEGRFGVVLLGGYTTSLRQLYHPNIPEFTSVLTMPYMQLCRENGMVHSEFQAFVSNSQQSYVLWPSNFMPGAGTLAALRGAFVCARKAMSQNSPV